MTMQMMRIFVLGAAAALSGLAPAAVAQEAEQAAVEAKTFAIATATSYTQIPAGSALDILAAADSELATDSTELTTATLTNAGYSVSRDGAYVVDVAAVLVRGVTQDSDYQTPNQGTTRGDLYTNADKSQADQPLTQGNLFSTGQGSLLKPAQQQRGGHLLRVSLSVYDRKSGLYVWRGQIERDSLEVDSKSSLQQMVPALLAHFNQSLPATEVPLN